MTILTHDMKETNNRSVVKITILLLLVNIFILATAVAQENPDFPPLANRYFGQKPPGLTPELFAPGIIATEKYMEGYIEFTPNMQEIYFTRLGGEYDKRTMHVMRYNNHQWSNATPLSTDLKQYRERYEPHWSEINNIEAFKDLPIIGFSVSSKGTYYMYFMDYQNGSGHLSYSSLIDGKYESPQKMNEEINAGLWKAHPYVAPDESYLMWDAEQEGVHGADIYISFRKKDGSWGPAINMGDPINTGAYEQGARVTPDGKYLVFWRGDEMKLEDGSIEWVGSPYWVDAQVIETLRPN